MTKRLSLLFTCLCLASASPLAARERARASLPPPQKKGAGGVAQPIKPMETQDEKPRAGWGGFYGGLNAGAGFSDTESR